MLRVNFSIQWLNFDIRIRMQHFNLLVFYPFISWLYNMLFVSVQLYTSIQFWLCLQLCNGLSKELYRQVDDLMLLLPLCFYVTPCWLHLVFFSTDVDWGESWESVLWIIQMNSTIRTWNLLSLLTNGGKDPRYSQKFHIIRWLKWNKNSGGFRVSESPCYDLIHLSSLLTILQS